MNKIKLNNDLAKQIREGEGSVELVDESGCTVGVVRRTPTTEEIARARSRASRGKPTLSWEEMMTKLREEAGL